jgi:preprotein translocase subunit SecA
MSLVRHRTSLIGKDAPEKFLFLSSSYHVPPLKKRAVNCDPSSTLTTSSSEHIWGKNLTHTNNVDANNLVALVSDKKSSTTSSITAATLIEEKNEMKINSTLLSYADSLYNSCEDIDSGDDEKMSKKHFKEDVINLLTDWILVNLKNPYPNQSEKDRLASLSGLSVQQICDWLANVRKRHLFPVIRY